MFPIAAGAVCHEAKLAVEYKGLWRCLLVEITGARGECGAMIMLAPLGTYGPRIAQVPCRGAMLGTITNLP